MIEKKQQPKIRIFSTLACPYCVTLEEFLKENGFSFEKIDVGVDEKAKQEMIERSGQMGVPVVEINNEIIIGFDRKKITELLGIKE